MTCKKCRCESICEEVSPRDELTLCASQTSSVGYAWESGQFTEQVGTTVTVSTTKLGKTPEICRPRVDLVWNGIFM
jgi:hypothetical protein